MTPSVPPSVTVDENDSGATVPPASPHLPDHGTTPSHPQSSGTPCEGTVCTNPNHGGGDDPAANGGAVMPNPNGDGSNVPCEGTVCTNPNHGGGGDPAANGGAVMPNPNGDRSNVPCEGTVCTNPNHGAGS
ncbi:hypothetical protein [Williamsia sp.]|uniref:hypothetical protein n=1 Tax=Williamsia sp. TaxID=1872085 RepID=UPI0039C93794